MGTIADKLTAAIASREAIRIKCGFPETMPFSEYAVNITIGGTPGGIDTTTANPPTAAQIVSGKEAWANGSKIVGTASVVTPSFDSSTGKFTVSAGFVNTAYSKSLGTITSSNTTVSDNTVTIPAGYNKAKFTKTVAAATVTETADSITISKGWLSSAITRNLGISTDSENPAIPELVYEGYEFFVNGERYEGTMPTADIIIEGMDGGGHTIRVTPGFVADEFEDFVRDSINLGFITATAEDIRLGKIGADEHGGMIEGTLVVPDPSTDIDVEYGYVDADGKFQALDLSGESPINVGEPREFTAIMYKTGVDEPIYDNAPGEGAGVFDVVKVISITSDSGSGTAEPAAASAEPVTASAKAAAVSTIPSRIIVGGLPDSHPANGVYEIKGDIVEGKALTDYSYSHVDTEGQFQIYYSTGMGMDDWPDMRWAIFDVYEQCPVIYKTDNPTSLLEACSWYTWSDDALRQVSVWAENTKLFDNIIASGFPDDTQGNGEYEWQADADYTFGGFYVNKAGNGRYIAFYDMEGDGGTWWLLTDLSFSDEPLAWLVSSPSLAPLTEPDGEQSWINVNEDSITVTFTVQRDPSSDDGNDSDGDEGGDAGDSGESNNSSVPTRLTVAGIPEASPVNGDYEVTAETAGATTMEGRIYRQVTGDLYENGYRAIKYYGGPEDSPWGENRWAIVLIEEDSETGETVESLIYFKEELPNNLIGSYIWFNYEYGGTRLFSVYPAGTSLFKSLVVSGFPSDDGMGRDLTLANGTYSWVEMEGMYLGGCFKHSTENYYIFYYDMMGSGESGGWWLNDTPNMPEEGTIAYSGGVPADPVTEPSGELGWYNDDSGEDYAFTTVFTVQEPSIDEPVDPLSIPLTFTAEEAGSTIKIICIGEIRISGVKYRLNTDGDWLDYTLDTLITLSNVGDIVQFYRTGGGHLATYLDAYTNFVMTGKIAASGNIQSLVNWSEEITGEYCYTYLFKGCTSLTKAPELPATVLQEACYYGMFYGCTNLIKAPDLPATTIPYGESNCYDDMFYGCSSLNSIKISLNSWPYSCCSSWVEGVADTGTFYKPSSLPEIRGTDNIPSGWTVVNEGDPEEVPSTRAVVVKATEYSGDDYVFSNNEITIDNCPADIGVGDIYIMSDLSLIQKLN